MARQLRRMVWGAAAAALVMTCAASEGFAVEPGDFTNYLRGATQGFRSARCRRPASMAALR